GAAPTISGGAIPRRPAHSSRTRRGGPSARCAAATLCAPRFAAFASYAAALPTRQGARPRHAHSIEPRVLPHLARAHRVSLHPASRTLPTARARGRAHEQTAYRGSQISACIYHPNNNTYHILDAK